MVTGLRRARDEIMSSSTEGGADAVRLMNGDLVNARRPPILPNADRNSVPLHRIIHSHVCVHVYYSMVESR